MLSAGIVLRQIRDSLGLTMRDVESASARIAKRHDSEEYFLPPSRLSDIETKGIVPSVFRLYSLAAIYRKPMGELLKLYEIATNTAQDWHVSQPANSHVVALDEDPSECAIPLKLRDGFDPTHTCNLGPLVEQWGVVPFAFLRGLASQNYTYAYVGSEDYTMYPILPPGTFLQIDESKNRVVEQTWRSEHERPIYLVETRMGFTCCWCSLRFGSLVLQSHPLSPAPVRVLKHPQEAEVVGQVVGVAMRLGYGAPEKQGREGEASGPRSDAVAAGSETPRANASDRVSAVPKRGTPG